MKRRGFLLAVSGAAELVRQRGGTAASLDVVQTTELTGTFSVRGYGAKGDGIADDSNAVQAALNAAHAAGAGVVWVPAGLYLVKSTLLAYQGVSIVGVGGGKLDDVPHPTGSTVPGAHFFFAPTVEGAAFLIVERRPAGDRPAGYSNTVLESFSVHHAGGAEASDGIRVTNATFAFRNVCVEGFAGSALRIRGAINSVVDNCLFAGSGWGIYFEATGTQSTSVAFRATYCHGNRNGICVQNAAAISFTDWTIVESCDEDAVVVNHASFVAFNDLYLENIGGYGFKVGAAGTGNVQALDILHVFTYTGAKNRNTVDFIYLQNTNNANVYLHRCEIEKASVLRAAPSVGNLQFRVGSGTAQKAAPSAMRASGVRYAAGTLWRARGDDGSVYTYVVTVGGTTGSSQPAGYGTTTIDLADGSARVSRYATADAPYINAAAGHTLVLGDTAAPLGLRGAHGAGPLVNWIGTSAPGTTQSITTWKTGATLAGYRQVLVNGQAFWEPFYNPPTAP